MNLTPTSAIFAIVALAGIVSGFFLPHAYVWVSVAVASLGSVSLIVWAVTNK